MEIGPVSRGDLVTIAIAGDYGKPRPALVVQADAFQALSSLTILQLTSELHDAPAIRIEVQPTLENGLRMRSQIQIDRTITVPRRRVGRCIGRLDASTMRQVDHALARFLGFG